VAQGVAPEFKPSPGVGVGGGGSQWGRCYQRTVRLNYRVVNGTRYFQISFLGLWRGRLLAEHMGVEEEKFC
jgi:hypothetical protein